MNAPSVSSARERGDSGRRAVTVLRAKWMVGRVKVLATNGFVCAWNGSSGIASEQVLPMLCVSSCYRRCNESVQVALVVRSR